MVVALVLQMLAYLFIPNFLHNECSKKNARISGIGIWNINLRIVRATGHVTCVVRHVGGLRYEFRTNSTHFTCAHASKLKLLELFRSEKSSHFNSPWLKR